MYNQILETYPELTLADFNSETGTILLQDDGDGVVYIAKWDYEQPIPDGLTVGKPSA